MRKEYKVDYKTSRPNRFAAIASDEPLVVMVDADVAKVFQNAEAVNLALRALIAALPKPSNGRIHR